MEIRKTNENDWDQLRDIRLRALAEAPYAFGSTLKREQARTEEQWRTWASHGYTETRITFVAVADGGQRFMGLASGRPDDDEPISMELMAMWVDPDARGKGVGLALVNAVASWARERGAPSLTLQVAEGNAAASAMYLRAGFVATGIRQPLPSNPSVNEEKFRLSLLPQ